MAVPGPTSWESFNFSDDVLEKIKAAKYETPTQIQQQAIPSILDGKDIIAMARTGSGKTAAFGEHLHIGIFPKFQCAKIPTEIPMSIPILLRL